MNISINIYIINELGLESSQRKIWRSIWIVTSKNNQTFQCSVMSNSLWPHGLQHARLPCPSPSPGACSNTYPSSQWCHPTILFSHRPLLLLPSIFPSLRVFSNESALCIKWPKCWSFSFSITPSSELNLLLLGNIFFTKYVLSCSVMSLLHDIYVLNKIFLIK